MIKNYKLETTTNLFYSVTTVPNNICKTYKCKIVYYSNSYRMIK